MDGISFARRDKLLGTLVPDRFSLVSKEIRSTCRTLPYMYSGFLLRVKTFVNFARFCGDSRKFYPRKPTWNHGYPQLSRYYRSIQHGRGDESLRKRATQIYNDYTPKQKAQIAKRNAKHGVTAPVRYGLHSVTRSCSRRAYRSNSQTAESHSGSNER